MAKNEFRQKLISMLVTISDNIAAGDFVLLRDQEKLIEGAPLHDIDTYAVNLDKAHKLLVSTCTSHGLFLKRTSKVYDFSSYILYDNFFNFIKLDIWTEFHWRGMEYFSLEAHRNSIRYYKGIPALNDAAQLELRLKKDLIFTLRIPPKKMTEVVKQYSELQSHLPNIAYDFIEKAIGSLNKKEQQVSLGNELRKACLLDLKKDGGTMLNFIKYSASRLIKLVKPSGRLIVLVGPDGAGKSTILNHIATDIGRNMFAGCETYYSRPGILPLLSEILPPFNGSHKSESVPDNVNDGPVTGALPGTLKVLYYSFDYFLFRSQLMYKLGLGKIIVFDRYYYDYYFQYFWKSVPFFMKRIAEILVPKPDLTILLQASPDSIIQRKPELNFETIEHQYNSFKSIKHIDYRTIRTDTCKSETLASLKKLLIESY